jgi:hypothetical protein
MHGTPHNKCNSDIHSSVKAQFVLGLRNKLCSFNGARIRVGIAKVLSAPLRCY